METPRSRSNPTSMAVEPRNRRRRRRKLGFLSFDLDDTLFPTIPVVKQADQAMIDTLRLAGFDMTEEDYWQAARNIRYQLTAPITYTQLRKRAIAQEMQRLIEGAITSSRSRISRNDEKDNCDMVDWDLVEHCFETWLTERHNAAERYLFGDAISMLQEIGQLHPDVCIGAITNGRGNPLSMTQTLSPYFEFCVSGEDDAVFPERKPQPGIYQHAWKQYQDARPHHHKQQPRQQQEAEEIEYVWCHVGDCLANDVGASACNGALAIWMAPSSSSSSSSLGSSKSNNERNESSNGQTTEAFKGIGVDPGTETATSTTMQPAASTATETERTRRATLALEGQAKVAAQISQLSELPKAIEHLLNKNDMAM